MLKNRIREAEAFPVRAIKFNYISLSPNWEFNVKLDLSLVNVSL